MALPILQRFLFSSTGIDANIRLTERGCFAVSSVGSPQALSGCHNANDLVDVGLSQYGFVTEKSLICYCDAYNLCNNAGAMEDHTEEGS